MDTQEIRLLCHITLEVPLEKTKEELEDMFTDSHVELIAKDGSGMYNGFLDIIDIEEESELYNIEE